MVFPEPTNPEAMGAPPDKASGCGPSIGCEEKAKKLSYYARNRARLLSEMREYRQRNPEYMRRWYKRNRKGFLAAQREKYQRTRVRRLAQIAERNQRPGVKVQNNATARARRARDPQATLATRLRAHLQRALKGCGKTTSTVSLLGCTIEQLRTHLEGQFSSGMTWENRGVWHIDHKKPCASFDLTDPGQQAVCFHFTNLQPLWAEENLRKGARASDG